MLDAIIISDTANDTFSASSKLRLSIHGQPASIQAIRALVLGDSFDGRQWADWHSAPKLNGISLLDCLQRHGFAVESIDSYESGREQFKTLLAQDPKVVAISTTFIMSKQALARLASDIRSLAPNSFIVAGGPFVFSSYLLLGRAREPDYDAKSPEEDYLFLSAKDRPAIDLYVVARRGESILAETIRRVREGLPVSDLPNTAHWNGTSYVFTDRIKDAATKEDLRIRWKDLPQSLFGGGVANVQAEGIFYWSIYPFVLGPLSPVYEPESRARYGLSGYMREWRHRTMDSRTAQKLVFQAFQKIERSGPIYSSDDLDTLARLPPERRMQFVRIRHALSKKAHDKDLGASELASAFAGVFGS